MARLARRWFRRCEDAASTAEYAALLGVLVVALVLVVSQLRGAVGDTFGRTTSRLSSVDAGAGSGAAGAGTSGSGTTGAGTPGNNGNGNGNANGSDKDKDKDKDKGKPNG